MKVSSSSSTVSSGPPGQASAVTTPANRFAAPFVGAAVSAKSPVPSGLRPYVVLACAVHEVESTTAPRASKSRTESALPSPKPNAASSRTVKPPAATVVPAGIVYVWSSSLSRSTYPPRSTVVLPVLVSSTQSPGVPSCDSTSLIRTGEEQSFAAPLVEAVVSTSGPTPSAQRP